MNNSSLWIIYGNDFLKLGKEEPTQLKTYLYGSDFLYKLAEFKSYEELNLPYFLVKYDLNMFIWWNYFEMLNTSVQKL